LIFGTGASTGSLTTEDRSSRSSLARVDFEHYEAQTSASARLARSI